MNAACERVAEFWDGHVARWLAGEDPLDDRLSDWLASYDGRGDGAVDRGGLVEPYTGDLRGVFTRRWLGEPAATHHDMLIFEAYPWHSTLINATLRPPSRVIDEFVWQPIAELPVREVFAFGRPWQNVATALGLPVVDSLGLGGRPYGSQVPDRAVRVYALPSGQRLVVEWHKGSAGPPSAAEVAVLKTALAETRRMSRGDERAAVEGSRPG